MAIAFVQGTSSSDLTSDSSEALAFVSNVTAGNFYVVGALLTADAGSGSAGAYVSSITSSLGNTFTKVGEVICADGSNRAHVVLYYSYNIAGGADTITMNFATGLTSLMYLAEFSGLLTTDPFDKTNNGTGNSTSVSTGLSGTLTQANELLIGIGGQFGAGTTWTPSVNEVANFSQSSMQYEIVSADTSKASTWTLAGAKQWAALLGTFKDVTAGGGGDPEGRLKGGKLIRGGLLRGGVL